MDQHMHGPKCGCAEYMFNEVADDLHSSIDFDRVDCLNEAHNEIKSILLPEDQKTQKVHFIESDVDSEVIVILPFLETVRIKQINIVNYDQNSAANLMKAYINVANVDFALIEGKATEEFILAENIDGTFACAVKASKFENVNQIALYIKSTAHDPMRVSYIGVKGVKTEMKKKLVNTVYELNPFASEVDPTKKVHQEVI